MFFRNETICVRVGSEEKVSVPAISIEAIICFSQVTVSTPLIGFCGERGISLVFLSPHGRFLGRVTGPVSGNVLLRKEQYATLDNVDFSVNFVRTLLLAKIRNGKAVLMRSARTTSHQKKAQSLYHAAEKLSGTAALLENCADVDSMRGIEGAAATIYFSQFDQMLSDSCEFHFEARSRRPPRNEVNAVLSFVYTLLSREIQSALESVGLDPNTGYLHALRPGRPSFALDLLEELRAPLCDRFTLTLFNKKQLSQQDFETNEEAVYLNDRGRRTVLTAWQRRKAEDVQHPFLNEKIQIGMIPFSQAMLFARVLRGDLDCYPPFVWR